MKNTEISLTYWQVKYKKNAVSHLDDLMTNEWSVTKYLKYLYDTPKWKYFLYVDAVLIFFSYYKNKKHKEY